MTASFGHAPSHDLGVVSQSALVLRLSLCERPRRVFLHPWACRSLGLGLFLLLGFLLCAIYSRTPTNRTTLRSFQTSFRFLLRPRRHTFQGVQPSRLLTQFLSSLLLSSFLALLLAKVSRGRLFSVRRLGVPQVHLLAGFSTAHRVPQEVSRLSVFFRSLPQASLCHLAPRVTLSIVRHWLEVHSMKSESGFCVILASLTCDNVWRVTGFSDGPEILVSIITPDSRFSNLDGGPSDVPSLRMSASWSDRGETDPLDPGHAFLQANSFAIYAGVSDSDSVSGLHISSSLVVPIASVRLWSLRSICITGAQSTAQTTLHDSPCLVGLRLQFRVLAAQARSSESRCFCRERERKTSTGLLRMQTG